MGTTQYDIEFVGTSGHGWPEKIHVTATAQDEPHSDLEALIGFLAAIDPDELERVALDRDDIEGPGGLTGAMMRQLIDWVRGG